MIILANLLSAIGHLLSTLTSIFVFILIARAIMSWTNADPYNGIVRVVSSITDPLLSLVRRYAPLQIGAFDFSPLALVFLAMLIQGVVAQSLIDYAVMLRRSLITP